MPSLQAEQIQDLIKLTLRNLGRDTFSFLGHDLQEFIAMDRLFRDQRLLFGSGFGMRWQVMVQNSGAAKNVGLYNVDDPNVADVMQTAQIDWRHTQSEYVIEDREVTMNSGPEEIADLIATRRLDGLSSLAEKFEDNFWGKPVDSSDNLTPNGVGYWIVKNVTDDSGFIGGVPSGFTDVAGIDPAVFDRWKNWAFKYTAISKTDAIREWREASTKTKFVNPNPVPGVQRPDKAAYYMPYSVLSLVEEEAEGQNDRLGRDVASMDGRTLFRGLPLVWVPRLDDATSGEPGSGEPIYGINWGKFEIRFLRGEYLNEQAPQVSKTQHRTQVVYVDNSYNFRLLDRRSAFVGSKTL